MAESFKYKRLEVSKLLFESWHEFRNLLSRKSFSSERHSFMFYPYPSLSLFGKKSKGKIIKYSLFSESAGGYCIYNKNFWYWSIFNQKNRGNKIENEIFRKKKFLTGLKHIVENFIDSDRFMPFSVAVEPKIPFKNFSHLVYTLPLISLSSAILEGTLREILAKYLQEEINKYIELGNKEGRSSHNNYQKILVAKQSLIESHSSMNSLLSEYSILFNFKASEIIPKNLIKIIDSLNTLRNITAHGTSMVTTNIEVQEDDYFKSWNKKVKELQIVLKKYFGSEDIYLNLADYRLADFYMGYVIQYLRIILNYLKGYDDSMEAALNNVGMINKVLDTSHLTVKYNQNYLDWFE